MGKRRIQDRTTLTISYAARKSRREIERRVVCIYVSSPPVTPAEVEIMQAHLDEYSAPSPHNDAA